MGTFLEIEHLSKTFPSQRALSDVSLTLASGRVHGLIGQNGCGKSTLIKVLSGYHSADPGSVVRVDSADVTHELRSYQGSRFHFIHQDLGLVERMSVLDNLALGRGYSTRRTGQIRHKAQRSDGRKHLGRFDIHLDLEASVADLAPSERTMVAVARALSGWETPRGLLVLDEATAALPRSEVAKLAVAIRAVAATGAAVLFVSHRLDEILELCDDVTALRDGRVVFSGSSTDLNHGKLLSMIVGAEFDEMPTVSAARHGGQPVFEVTDLVGPRIDQLSLSVREGEIVGVTGLAGSGKEELCPLVFGATRRTGGRVAVHGAELRPGDISASIRNGVALVPADRRRDGCIPSESVAWNITLPRMNTISRWGRVSRRLQSEDAQNWVDRVRLRPPRIDNTVANLSGGNQQKVVVARALRLAPSVLLLDEPTKGIDVGAKASILTMLRDAARRDGTAILVASSEAAELAALCDRVLLLDEGQVVSEVSGDQLTEENVVRATISANRRRTLS